LYKTYNALAAILRPSGGPGDNNDPPDPVPVVHRPRRE